MIYNYSRDLVNGAYNIDNPLRLDGEGRQIRLAIEVETHLPNKIFTINCYEGNCDIDFQQSLTIDEKAILDTVVSNHKNNT